MKKHKEGLKKKRNRGFSWCAGVGLRLTEEKEKDTLGGYRVATPETQDTSPKLS